jgi:hypothetical protein
MHRIVILPDIQPAGYPANLMAGYQLSGAGRIPDIQPDFQLNIQKHTPVSSWFSQLVEEVFGVHHRDHPVQIQVTAQLFIWIECEFKMYTPKLY